MMAIIPPMCPADTVRRAMGRVRLKYGKFAYDTRFGFHAWRVRVLNCNEGGAGQYAGSSVLTAIPGVRRICEDFTVSGG